MTVSDLPQQNRRDQPDENTGFSGGVCQKVQKKTQTRTIANVA